MSGRKGKYFALLCAAALIALLSGCTFVATADDLFSLPKLPEEYVELEEKLAELVNNGYEYAAPTGGDNIQLVQMMDVDGDGEDEAVVFLRKTGDEKPMKIYVFKQSEEGYEAKTIIEESAASIGQVDYEDMNGDGELELIVGWLITSTDVSQEGATTTPRILSAYDLDHYNVQKILETSYSRYSLTDLDGNGAPELIVIAADTAGGNSNAEVYEWDAGVLTLTRTAKLSVPPSMLSSVREGGLTDGGKALFVTGIVDEQNLVTDLLVLGEDGLTNLMLDEQSGVSRLIYRNSTISPRDINYDGVLEFPISYELPKVSADAQPYWGIHWTAFDSSGEAQVVKSTYHNLTDGWYLSLPESWKDVIMITGVSSTIGERAVTFGVYQGEDEPPLDILTIYTETGDSREYKSNKGKRFVLLRQSTTIYAAEYLESYSTWSGAMSEDVLKDAFSAIRAEWYLN
jgi:hypothetical protein